MTEKHFRNKYTTGMPQDSALTICVLAGYASARPGVGGDSASDSSVVDDMDRKAAAVAGDSEGSGMDISRRAAAWSRDVPGG